MKKSEHKFSCLFGLILLLSLVSLIYLSCLALTAESSVSSFIRRVDPLTVLAIIFTLPIYVIVGFL